jgi:hypothetical protein
MRKLYRLPQYFLILTAILFSSKSFAEVCPSSGITSSITCTGNIATSNFIGYGIYLLNGSGSNVNMSGDITTTGAGAIGIRMDNHLGSSNINNVNIVGNITTSNILADGIALSVRGANNSNNLNMTGNITTSSRGIYLDTYEGTNNTNTVNMLGNITSNDDGINLNDELGSNNTNIVNMTGNITTIFGTAIKIYTDMITSNINTVNMTGNITTRGPDTYGISLYNDGTSTTNTNTVNITGNITMEGDDAIGIYFHNSGTNNINSVNMIGNISTEGVAAFGISLFNYDYALNSTNIVNMTGNITTSGPSAYGISLNNHNGSYNSNTVNMTGNITTSGPYTYGIILDNSGGSYNSNTVNIAGRISATGADSYAVYAFRNSSTSSNTVQLNKGSSVIGGIFGQGPHTANNFLKLNLGAGASYSFATTGFTVTDLNGRPMVTGSAYAAGVGNITTASQSLYERTSQITQSLDDRVRTYDAKQNTSQDFWVNTYYSDSNRGGQGLSGSNLSFNQYRSGITAGFNVKNSYTPTELIVNYEHGKLNIDEGNQGISSNSVMAGALFPDIKKLFTGTLSAKALVGYSDFSGDRKVLTNDVALNGSRNVTANYQSTHLTIGSAWTKTLYQTDKMILDTLVGIDLNTQHINSYSESDLFKWNGRTINQLQERVTLGMEIKPLVKPLTLFGRVGIERRDLISGENQNYAINNTTVSYNDSNQRNTYATLNAGAYYPLTPTVKAYAQVRYYDSTKDIDSLSGSIGISGQF